MNNYFQHNAYEYQKISTNIHPWLEIVLCSCNLQWTFQSGFLDLNTGCCSTLSYLTSMKNHIVHDLRVGETQNDRLRSYFIARDDLIIMFGMLFWEFGKWPAADDWPSSRNCYDRTIRCLNCNLTNA